MVEGDFQESVCLSRLPQNPLDDGPVPQSPQDDFKNIPDKAALYPYDSSGEARDSCFDHRRYNLHKPWPLYNVMMIRRDNGVASRVALGTIHFTAFVEAKPVMKVITLAWAFGRLQGWGRTESCLQYHDKPRQSP